ncbi:MAG: sortase-associated OmpA-like protein PdsO [Gammaproteobacteria bacterium]|nr:sortase-associated OmpA-like protein PdsO [Gammaproteobacteria bacterium]
MFKKFSFLVILCFAASTALAEISHANYDNPTSKGESTGIFGGAIIGGVIGGPPGAVIGAGLGAFIGDGWNARGQVKDLQATLFETQLQLAAIQDELRIVEGERGIAKAELDSLRNAPPQVLPAFLSAEPLKDCCDNTVVSIHFRTGSSDIESHYVEQLEGMANIAKQMTSAKVEITGYADRNGDANQNLSLSRKRSEEVKTFLTANGIDNASITTVAYGETRPLQAAQSFESDFFDRRVIVRLRDNSKAMLTQTPDNQ